MYKYRNITKGIIFVVIAFASGNLYSDTQMQNRMKLLNKLDLLDSLDFQDEVSTANKCIIRRNFHCARTHILKASKLAHSRDDKGKLKRTEVNLDDEIELVRREEVARQNEIARRQEVARQREVARKQELARQEKLRLARLEESRRQERRAEEQSNAAAWGFAARMLGTAIGASAAGASIDSKGWADISAGAMKDSRNGGTGMSNTNGAINNSGNRYQKEQQQRYETQQQRSNGYTSPGLSNSSSESNARSYEVSPDFNYGNKCELERTLGIERCVKSCRSNSTRDNFAGCANSCWQVPECPSTSTRTSPSKAIRN